MGCCFIPHVQRRVYSTQGDFNDLERYEQISTGAQMTEASYPADENCAGCNKSSTFFFYKCFNEQEHRVLCFMSGNTNQIITSVTVLSSTGKKLQIPLEQIHQYI